MPLARFCDRHAERIRHAECKTCGHSCCDDDEAEEASAEEHRSLRRIVGKSQILAPRRPDVAFDTNRLARSLTKPSKSDIIASKRLLRNLRGTQDLGLKLQVQNRTCSTLTVFTDSDWAGDRPTRKSVSSWVVMLDAFLISAGARAQSVIAQSSFEAEYVAATAATSEVKYILDLWTTREHPSAFRQLWLHW